MLIIRFTRIDPDLELPDGTGIHRTSVQRHGNKSVLMLDGTKYPAAHG